VSARLRRECAVTREAPAQTTPATDLASAMIVGTQRVLATIDGAIVRRR